MTLELYLTSVRRLLRLPREKSDNIIAEIHAHLLEDIRHRVQNGTPKHEAVERACQEFGNAYDVSREFMRSSAGFFRTPLRVIFVTLLALFALTMTRRAAYGIPVFGSALAPFYTDEWAFFLIEAILSYVVAAVFLFRRFQRIARSPKEFRRLVITGVVSVFALDLMRNIVPDALNNFSAFYITPTTQDILQAVFSKMIFQGTWIIITMVFPIFLLLLMPTSHLRRRTAPSDSHYIATSSIKNIRRILFPFLIMSAGIFMFLTAGVLPFASHGWCFDNNFVGGCAPSVKALSILTMSLVFLGPISVALFIAKKIEKRKKCDRMET
jgi:hypothetical protein